MNVTSPRPEALACGVATVENFTHLLTSAYLPRRPIRPILQNHSHLCQAIADGVANQAKFSQAAEWLRNNASAGEAVIATQAHTLNYASGYPALTLPNRQGIDVLRRLAQRYSARFVVVTERVGLYPDALDAAEAIRVRKRLDANGVVIYELP